MAGELPAAVFSDVDGTLLDGDHRVSPRTAAAARFLSDPRVRREEKIVGVTSTEGALGDHFSERGLHKFLLVGEPESIERAEVRAAAARVTWLDNVHDGLAEAIFSLIGEA